VGGEWVKLTRVIHWRALRKRQLTFRLSQMRDERGAWERRVGIFRSASRRGICCVYE